MNFFSLLVITLMCLVIPGMAKGEEFTFECKRVRPSEMIRALRSLADFGVSFKEEPGKVIVAVESPFPLERLKELMERIDAPPGSALTRFLKLRFGDATHVASVISMAFPTVAENEGIPLQVVPNVRTNEVIVMGNMRDIQAAEALVRLIDDTQAPACRGCGDARLILPLEEGSDQPPATSTGRLAR